MVRSITKSESAGLPSGIKAPVQKTLLTPRFYTTNFDAVAQMDLSGQQAELEAILAELRADYNRYHFVRNEEFEQGWEHVDGKTRRAVRLLRGNGIVAEVQFIMALPNETLETIRRMGHFGGSDE